MLPSSSYDSQPRLLGIEGSSSVLNADHTSQLPVWTVSSLPENLPYLAGLRTCTLHAPLDLLGPLSEKGGYHSARPVADCIPVRYPPIAASVFDRVRSQIATKAAEHFS